MAVAAKPKRIVTKSPEEMNRRLDLCVECLEQARRQLLKLDGVIGVGIGPREKNGQLLEDEISLLVYVEQKKDKGALAAEQLVPREVMGVPTDVVVPGNRSMPFHYEHDFAWLDFGKIHQRNPYREVNLQPAVDYDVDHVAVLEIDNSFVTNGNIDWVKAIKRFLQSHPDAFDFITFYVDTSTGLPGQGSWHSGVFNNTSGINYYAGSNLDNRATYGSTKLRAIHSIGWLGNYVLLQETGHMWGAFVRNRDTQNGPNLYDLLIGSSGQGLFHWGRFFDNHHSPMDYDGIDWQALGGSQFQSHGVADDFFHFHPLDLYLMGLCSPQQVGPCLVITNPSGNSGTITGTPKNVTVQNVIWAEGVRNPAYPNTQRKWKQAFVVLTKNAQASATFAQNVAAQRREFTWQFYKATRFLGKADTTLWANTVLPQISNIAVAVDNDRAIIGWKTNVRTKGRVNFATSPAAFVRDQAHSEPFSTVGEAAFATSHGVLLTGLTPNTTYYFEIIAETEQGLLDRNGVQELYTRKTNDTCPADINNVAVRMFRLRPGNKIIVNWKTDEPTDSRVFYGTSTPPALTKYDPYPTTNHSIVLSGLGVGTYYIGLQSRDAAGNVSTDTNGGAYYQVTIPSFPWGLAAVSLEQVLEKSQTINAAIQAGQMARAIEHASHLILDVAEPELAQIVRTRELPEENLEAGYAALQELASRLDASVQVVERGDGYMDLAMEPDPLSTMSCVEIPADIVVHECAAPVLSQIASAVRPGLNLEIHPTLGLGHYRLSRS